MTKPKAEEALTIYSPEFLNKVKQFKADMHKFYTEIGAEKTPKYDGAGMEIIRKRPDGYDYIVETYMRNKLDEHFPGWSWEAAAPMQLILNYLLVQGHLCIIDEHLFAFGINPPIRKFYGVGAARIQFKRDMALTPENVVDIDKNAKSADSAALKYSINRLTRIGDDVYGKRIEEEGAGSIEEIIMATEDPSKAKQMFMKYIQDRHILVSKVLKILKVDSLDKVADYRKAYEVLKEKE